VVKIKAKSFFNSFLCQKSVFSDNGRAINITKCWECIESAVININGGNIHIVSTDDGMNASSGKGSNNKSSAVCLYINGGYVFVNPAGIDDVIIFIFMPHFISLQKKDMIQSNEGHLHYEQHGENDHQHTHEAGKNLALAFFLNLSFCIIELIGGFWTNSIAILSDALHDFGDSLSLGMAWYFQKVSKRKPDSKYTYGYKRFSTLSALLNSFVLLVGSAIVLYECILRLFEPVETNAKGMFVLAIVGVLVNGAAVFRLKKGSSLNERVISLHLLEDVLGWLAVLIGSVVMMFADVPVLDPILSIGISFYILFHVYQNLKSVFRVILQGKPSDVDETAIRESLLSLPKVHDLHDLHLWTMDSEYMVLTVHLVVDGSVQKEEQKALRAAAHQVLKTLDIDHSTIEIEYDSESCEWCEDETEIPV